ncbi:MAG TPA: glycine--tRNA ligase subunit beta [Gaiellaceae bacterium]|nr:glycine--tRNA ligase subunit beta [Gaiellaceae bacterium]
MPSLLFEIGCEELPASAVREATAQLRERWLPTLGEGTVYAGPRRLALHVPELAEREPDRWVQGPPEHLRERAAEGFARKQGVLVDELEVRDGFLGVLVAGRPVAETLPERLAEIVHGLSFSKSMVWDEGRLRFSRPVRWLCAKLDGETVELEVAGLRSGGRSSGHRFAHGAVEIPHADAYLDTVRAAGVEPDEAERRRLILEGLDAIGGWSDPAGVLEEVVHLVESPVVLAGSFAERFLELPGGVVRTAMQSHQRYFPLEGARFAFVANGGDPATVVAGNERVLEGRLEDAHFTFERDVAKGIDALAAELDAITFVAGAGSFADKAARLAVLVAELGGGDAPREAARLAKADQAAELVREFPDLEGAIGAEYARLAGYPEAVCAAIEEQYLPGSAEGPLPQTESGRLLAAAERIDNLAVAFVLGQRPTGSRDPHGLRRAAIGLCRLAVEGGLEIDVAPLVARDLALLVEQQAEVQDDPADVAGFVLERLEGLLDVPVEFVRAARAGTVSELGAVARLAETLAAEAASDEFERAYVAFDRANRLAGKADGAAGALDPALATDEAEVALVRILGEVSPRIEAAVSERDFARGLAAAAELGPPVDRFFDEVLVMADDANVRANRLRLLLDVRDAVGALGDLSQIPR